MGNQPVGPFAELIKRLRRRAGMTQEELAGAAQLSPRTVSDLERGVNRTAREATADLLADALGLTGAERAHFLTVASGKPPANGQATGPTDPTAVDEGLDDAEASSLGWLESAVSRNFTGRQQELAALREAWSRAAAGHRVLALVGGEPGIGKTALVGELARLVRAERGLVLYGRWDEHALAPYQAFREALADYARACPRSLLEQDLDGLAAEIARVCPEPAQRIGVAVAEPLAAAEAERFRLFESLDGWIQRMGTRHPLLLVLDDLQWADLPALLLLSHLMQARRAAPLLAVAMYRDSEPERGELSTVLHALSRDTDCRRLTLRGLEQADVSALLAAAPAPGTGAARAAELARDTAGNPFFLLEMARQQTPAIPESVRDMVRWRLQRVSDGCAAALEVASVIGERFDTALVAAAATLDYATVADRLDEAARAGLITEADDDPDYWRFSHPVARRVTAERLSRGTRAQLHQRIGEALESRFGVSAAELAHHFGQAAASAGSAAAAIGYERLAAQRALAEVAAEVAVGHLRTALKLLDRFGPRDPALRCELLLELAAAHDRAGEYASRDERFFEAAGAARDLGDGGLLLRAALGYGGILPATVGPDPRAEQLLTEARQRLGPGDSTARATVLARLAHWQHNARPYPERLALSEQSLAMARADGDPKTLATVLTHRAWALDGPDDVDDTLAVATEVLGIGAQQGDPELRLEGLRIRVAAQFENGQYPAAVLTALTMKELAEQVGHPEFIRLATMWDITVANLEGRFPAAQQLAAELARRLARLGHSQAGLIPIVQVFPWGLLRGAAARFLPTLQDLSAYEPASAVLPAITAWCLAEAGDADGAAALLARTDPAAAAAADKNYLWWAVPVGFAGAVDLTGDQRWAEAIYQLIAPYAGHNATLGVATFLGAADHWLGVLAAAAGRLDQSAGHLETALARHQEMGSRPLTALTEEVYSSVLSRRGNPGDAERARAFTTSATVTARELALPAILNRLRRRR